MGTKTKETEKSAIIEAESFLDKFANMSELVDLNPTIAVQPIFRELASRSALISESKSAFNQVYANSRLFIPLGASQDAYSCPLVVVSDEEEVDKESSSKLQSRANFSAPLFPLVVFPDSYFRIASNESFAYTEICDRFEEASKHPVMAFREGDIFPKSVYVRRYASCVSIISRLWYAKVFLEEAIKYVLSKIDEACSLMDNLTQGCIIALANIAHIKALVALSKTLESDLNQCIAHQEKVYGELRRLKEEYDVHIRSIVIRKPPVNDSKYAIKFDLTYYQLQTSIQDLCSKAESLLDNETYIGYSEYDTLSLVSKTIERITASSAGLSFVGTFSSGKTTMINALLTHHHKLTTSGRHNTAVLTELALSNTGEDYYVLEYKDHLSWDIIRPVSYASRSLTNPLNEDATITAINKSQYDSGWEVEIVGKSSRTHRRINIGGGHRLAVKKGDTIYRGKSLVETGGEGNYKLCTLAELEYMISLYSSKKATDIVLEVDGKRKSGINIKSLLSSLVEKAKHENVFKRDNAGPTINVDTLRSIIPAEIYPSGGHLLFDCGLLIGGDSRPEKLDDEGWKRLTGDEEAGIACFAESPSCYMPARSIHIYLNNEFVKYCSIVDTPGLGSVTDEHDQITERYIRDQEGQLIVMIAVNLHTWDQKFVDFFYSLADIYRDSKELKKEDVVFVLNCFMDKAPEAYISSLVAKIKHFIEELGFPTKKFYVCDLKKELKDNVSQAEMCGEKSFAQFQQSCIKELIDDSIKKRYQAVCSDWKLFFSENERYLSRKAEEARNNAEEHRAKLDEVSVRIRSTEKISIPSIDSYIAEVNRAYAELATSLETRFTGTRRGIITRHRQKAIEEELECGALSIVNLREGITSAIKSPIANVLNRISYESESDIDPPNVADPSGSYCIVLTGSKLNELLHEADEETHLLNKKKSTEYYMERVRNLLETDRRETVRRITEYYERNSKLAKKYQSDVIKELRDTQAMIENPSEAVKLAEWYESAVQTILDFRRQHFSKINFDLIR